MPIAHRLDLLEYNIVALPTVLIRQVIPEIAQPPVCSDFLLILGPVLLGNDEHRQAKRGNSFLPKVTSTSDFQWIENPQAGHNSRGRCLTRT